MKHTILLLTLVLAAVPKLAFGYSSQAGLDPVNTGPEIETKAVLLSTGVTSDVPAGRIMSYSTSNDGYTVTNVGAQTLLGSNLIACVSKQVIASSSTIPAPAAVPCVTKGYVASVAYDTTVNAVAINRGDSLCAGSTGKAVSCGAVASESNVVALEAIAANATGNMKVMVKAK